jgi:hypothetical protein
MTYDEFIKREIRVWGEDYIFALLDSGYEAVELISAMGTMRWTWRKPLTTAPASATVGAGSSVREFTPVFSHTDRASRG